MPRLIMLLIGLMGAGCSAVAEDSVDAPRPNIVLIMADDLGYGDLSCYGATHVSTPNIDALAKSGIRFTDYHSNGAVCSPTRAALMTGRYPQRTGVEGVITAARHREVGLPLEEVTIAEVLRDAGYATAMYGKWHLGYDIKKFGPLKQGFQTFEGFVSGNVDYFNKIDQEGHKDWYVGDELKHVEGYVTDLINDRAVDWIGEHVKQDKDKPFFLYLAHGAPHYPLQGPDDKGFREVGKKIREMPEDKEATYKAMIESMDAGIGRVVAELEKHGLTENTLVIFCSDNGHSPRHDGSAGELRGSKGTVYEGGHRVPMVMQWPAAVESTEQSNQLLIGMDFFPTFVRLAGAELPNGRVIDGVDMFDAVKAGQNPPFRTLHWVHGKSHAIRFGNTKIVFTPNKPTALYMLDKDLAEAHDVSNEYKGVVVEFEDIREQWLKEVRKDVAKVSG